MIWIRKIFTPKSSFTHDEEVLKHQIFALLVISLFFGIGVLIFSFFRLYEGNLIVGISQFLLAVFLLTLFFRLKNDKSYYYYYSNWFMILFFTYTTIIFFNVPQNELNIMWIISLPILIFFFLNRKRGIVMFFFVFIFILYLVATDYPYTIAEYVTLIAAFLVSSFVMYTYENVKDREKENLILYSHKLQKEVELKTADLKHLNNKLEEKIKEEVAHRLEQEQMLLRQSRMASMGQMIDSIAHQWRQPLMNINAVMMNLDRAIETSRDSEYMQKKVYEIFSLTAHMSKTIEDFRNLLKIEKERSIFNIHESISSVLLLTKNSLKGIDIVYEYDKNIAINSYKSELIQVLIILLNNASEALSARNIPDKKIFIKLQANDKNVTISIEDNALGVAKENLDKVFDPYFTTKKQNGGTGLGLYIAKIIIEHSMGGKLSVSNSNLGASFVMKIPNF